MGSNLKCKLIVASIMAAFTAVPTSSAFANALADTTLSTSNTVTLPIQSSATTATQTPLLNGVSYTLTEVTAGAFTPTSYSSYALGNASSLLSNSYIGLQLTSGGTQNVNFSYLPAGAIKITADNSVGIAGATLAISSVSMLAANSNVSIVFNGDTWNFTTGTTANQLNISKNGVSVATAVPAASSTALVNVIAVLFNTAYGAGTAALDTVATSTGASAQLNLISSRASLSAGVANTAATTFAATVTSDNVGVVVGTTTGAVGTGVLPAPIVSGDQTSTSAPFNTPLTTVGNTGNYLTIPILKNNASIPAKIMVSNIYVNTGSATGVSGTTTANVNFVVAPGTTTAGVSKGASENLATVAVPTTSVSTGSPLSIAPGGSVTVNPIVLQENLPAALANNAMVTLTLPTGYSWSTSGTVVSATSSGGATTVGSLSASGNALTYTVGAAGQSATFPSKVTISGLSVSAPSSALASTTQNVTVTAAGSVNAATLPYLNIQGGTASAVLNGTAANVYTFRNYASGKNGGALTARVDLKETLAGTLLANTSINVNLVNAVAGTTAIGVTTVSSGPSFANLTGGFQMSTATATNVAGYSAAGAVFLPSTFSYNISAASTSVLSNTLTLGSLTIGPSVGPVRVTLANNVVGSLSPVTIANATNATNTSTTGSIPNAAIGGKAVTLPTITVTESAAGALQTEVGDIGQVSFTLTNGVWDVAASQSVTWCGVALPSSNITGSGTNVLTVSLASVSTMACALKVKGKATAALNAAPFAAISVTVNAKLSDTGQASRRELQVATAGGCCRPNVPIFPVTTYFKTSRLPTAQIFTPSFNSAPGDEGGKADIYAIAYYQGFFWYKMKAVSGCKGWTIFSPQSGDIPQAYEDSVTLETTYDFDNINDCDVTAIKGVSYYIGYGIGTSTARTWINMLVNGTFSNSPVFLTN